MPGISRMKNDLVETIRYPLFFRFIGQLSTVPYSYNPYAIILNLVEKTIGTYDYFTKREFRKLRQLSSRFWKLLETGQRFFCLLAKSYCRRWLVAVNMCDGFKKLVPTCGRE